MRTATERDSHHCPFTTHTTSAINPAPAVEQPLRVLVLAARDGGLQRLRSVFADELGVDSVRLRAHASTSEARTLVRSRKRLAELLATALDQLSPDERARHEAKVSKHEQAIARCEAEGRTNFVVTSPSAGLLKFPDGASAPGHRVTVVAAGVRERLILNVLMDADSHDFGKAAVLLKTRALLDRLGISSDAGLQAALDAGYLGEGNDVALLGPGNDAVAGEAGNDRISCGPGSDMVDGRADHDVLRCNDRSGKDQVYCGYGVDTAWVDRGDAWYNCEVVYVCTRGVACVRTNTRTSGARRGERNHVLTIARPTPRRDP